MGYNGDVMKYYLVIRDSENKNLDVLEFGSMSEASEEKKKRRSEGHEGQLVIGQAESKEEFLETFDEYRVSEYK